MEWFMIFGVIGALGNCGWSICDRNWFALGGWSVAAAWGIDLAVRYGL